MIRWLSAFIDLPAASVDRDVEFWCAVTASTLSPVRGDSGQFATLVPPDGDAYLRVQRIGGEQGRIHLDVHVADRRAAADRAVALGATIVDDPGHIVMTSPGGLVFCFVGDEGESTRPLPYDLNHAGPSLVDQLAIDVPSSLFDQEAAFWSALTGWPWCPKDDPEFEILERAEGMPFRFLLQRLGDDDTHQRVTAHLDIAAGRNAAAVAAEHCRFGAEIVGEGNGESSCEIRPVCPTASHDETQPPDTAAPRQPALHVQRR